MKILQINSVYKEGSTGKIVHDLHSSYLMMGYDSYVIYGRGNKVKEKNVYKISTELGGMIHSVQSRLFGVDFGFSFFSTNKAIKIIKRLNPDIVHLHCLNGHFINVYRILKFLKQEKIKTVLTLHAEIMHTAGCEHAMECDKWIKGCYECKKIRGKISHIYRDDAKHCYALMKEAFAGFDNLVIVGVSEWLTKRASQSTIFRDAKFTTVFNGLNTQIFHYKNEKTNKDKYYGTLLHVTPDFTHPIKGGKYVLELAKIMPNFKFIIVGFNYIPKNVPKNVFCVSKVKDQSILADYYSNCDVTLLTSKRETFSMVLAESLCCGTPVVGFKAGGPESIAIKKYTSFVDQGDINMLKKAVIDIINKKILKKEISTEAIDKYSIKTMATEYLKVYSKFTSE